MTGPLTGFRVFDLTIAGVGPWASKLLGEMGADVIHIDVPNTPLPDVPPSIQGVGMLKIIVGYNKRRITLDLKGQRDREVAYKLLKSCDVFLENMRPGVARRLGLDYETLLQINPRIVYCNASGYGQTGTMVSKPGADGMIQAYSGFTSTTGQPGRAGELFRFYGHLDFTSSVYIVEAILTALLHRERTGEGQKVECAMAASGIALQTSRIAEYFATGKTAPRMGSAVTTTVPHQAFLCQNQEYITVGVVKEEQWPRLCDALGRPELANDTRFATNPLRVQNRELLMPILEEVFKSKPTRWWEIKLTKAIVPHSRVLSFKELRWHPQVLENGFIVETPTRWGNLYVEGMPWRFSETPGSTWLGYLPGEDDRELLKELGVARSPQASTS